MIRYHSYYCSIRTSHWDFHISYRMQSMIFDCSIKLSSFLSGFLNFCMKCNNPAQLFAHCSAKLVISDIFCQFYYKNINYQYIMCIHYIANMYIHVFILIKAIKINMSSETNIFYIFLCFAFTEYSPHIAWLPIPMSWERPIAAT